MSADDSDLDYLHVPRNEMDAAIVQLEAMIESPDALDLRVALLAVSRALRALHRGKQGRW